MPANRGSWTRCPTPLPSLSARLADVQSSPVRDILELTQRAEVISFAGGLPAPELFPAEMVAQAFATALAPTVAARALQYSTTEGDPELRALLAERLAGRGLDAHADEILVTTGSQQALGLVASVLLDPGDVVLVENPSYLAALQCFGFAGARLVTAPCDERRPRPRGAARRSSPSTGRSSSTSSRLPEPDRPHAAGRAPRAPRADRRRARPVDRRGRPVRRAALRRRAARADRLASRRARPHGHGLVAVEGPRARAAHRLPARARSRCSARSPSPSRRPTCTPRPSTSTPRASRCRPATSTSTSTRICAEYRRRRDALLGGLAHALPEGSTFNHPDGGMFVWARLPEGWDAGELLRAALRHDVAFVPGAPFYAGDPDPRTLRLSFTTHPPAEIVEGLARLRRAAAA